jgi:hypothetical protein
LEGETRHGEQKQRAKGRVWRPSCGVHIQFLNSGPSGEVARIASKARSPALSRRGLGAWIRP